MARPTALPWRKPRHELLLLVLVGVAALSPVYVTSTQDVSRFCLTRALEAGTLQIEPCAGRTVDRSVYHGRVYSNKPPGMSALAVPAAELVRLPAASRWTFEGDPRLWAVRVLTSGLAFLVCAFAVGRIAEGLVPGTGGFTLVTLALGTLMAPFAATGFDHVLTAALAFGAFVLAWGRRPGLAGVAAGVAYAVEYQAAAILLLVGLYVALQGLRPLARFAAGALPGVALSAAYSWAAFGRPWRTAHNYLLSHFPGVNENAGILGVQLPSAHGLRLVFVGDRGLLVASPVLAVAAVGLWLLWRRGFRAEASVAALVTTVFVLGNCGYGDPYGGISAGPRYLIPALPFLTVGLAPAFSRLRRSTTALAVASIIAAMALTLTWAESADTHYRGTVWGEIARFLTQGTASRLYDELAKNALVWAGPNRLYSAAVVCACAAAAFLIAVARSGRR